MKRIRLIFSAVLSLSALSACGSEKQLSTEKASTRGALSESENALATEIATAREGRPASAPFLTSCYRGDSWSCEVEALILKETNLLRAPPLQPLIVSYESSYVARRWSITQSQVGDISHDGFPAVRESDLKLAFNATWKYKAENVALTQTNNEEALNIAKTFVLMWKESPGHYQNIIGKYSFIGIGVTRVGRTFYATQLFH